MDDQTQTASTASSASNRDDGWRYLELKHTLHGKLLERINLDRLAEIDAPRVRKEVRAAVAALVAEEAPQMQGDERESLIDQILDEVFGLGPLDPLMQDDTVSDILVTTSDLVHVERFGKLKKTGVRFKDAAHLTRIIQKIVGQAGRRIDESSPMVDCRLPDGSRVNAVIPPVAFEGPLLSIRKFSKDPMTADELVEKGTLSEEMREYLYRAVKGRRNILISGGTAGRVRPRCSTCCRRLSGRMSASSRSRTQPSCSCVKSTLPRWRRALPTLRVMERSANGTSSSTHYACDQTESFSVRSEGKKR